MKKNLAFALAFPLAGFFIIRFGLDFNGLYGQDGHVYFQFAQEFIAHFPSSSDFSNFLVPPFYPFLAGLFGKILGHPGFLLQLLSSISLGGIMYLTSLIVRDLYPDRKSLEIHIYLLLTLFLSPYMFRGAMVVMTDLLAGFFCIASFWFYLKYRESSNVKFWIGLVAAAILAFMTRYAVAPLLVLPCLDACRLAIKEKKIIHFLHGIWVLVICAIPYFVLKQGESPEFVGHHLMDTWSPLNLFRSQFSGPDGASNYTMVNIITVFYHFFHPAYFFLGLPLLFFARKELIKRKELWIIIAAILGYSLFVGGLNFQNKRYLILSFPLVLIILSSGYFTLIDKIPQNLNWIVFSGIILVQVFFCTYVFKSFYQYNKIERELAELVIKAPATNLYTFELNQALISYSAPHQIINLYHERIESFQTGDLLLVNPSKWAFQWKDRNPMINWENAEQNYSLKIIKKRSDGWGLYKVLGK